LSQRILSHASFPAGDGKPRRPLARIGLVMKIVHGSNCKGNDDGFNR